MSEDLHKLYLAQTTKLARVTAAIGLAGDQPTEQLEAQARQLKLEHSELKSLFQRALFIEALSPASRALEERDLSKKWEAMQG